MNLRRGKQRELRGGEGKRNDVNKVTIHEIIKKEKRKISFHSNIGQFENPVFKVLFPGSDSRTLIKFCLLYTFMST